MTVLVDTSVWVDFFNGHSSPQADALVRFIEGGVEIATCGVVLAEFFQGLRRDASFRRLEPYFRAMPLLSPSPAGTYLRAARLFRDLQRDGTTVRSTIDCLIACLAEEHGCRLLAKDRDMERILASPHSGARPALIEA